MIWLHCAKGHLSENQRATLTGEAPKQVPFDFTEECLLSEFKLLVRGLSSADYVRATFPPHLGAGQGQQEPRPLGC